MTIQGLISINLIAKGIDDNWSEILGNLKAKSKEDMDILWNIYDEFQKRIDSNAVYEATMEKYHKLQLLWQVMTKYKNYCEHKNIKI